MITNRAGDLQVNELSLHKCSSLYLLCSRVTRKNIKHSVFSFFNEVELFPSCTDEKYYSKYKRMSNIF